MNFYPFHIGDYISHTSHLTDEEDLAYRRMIDLYYMTEAPFPNDASWIARRVRTNASIVTTLLNEFFELENDNLWHSSRADKEIAKYLFLSESGKKGAEKRWGNRDVKATNSHPNSHPIATPIATKTKNQDQSSDATKTKKRKTSMSLSKDTMPESYEDFIKVERPDLDPLQTYYKFCDYWLGNGETKADWLATWRNWVRNEKKQFKPKSDVSNFDELMRNAK